MARVGLIVGGLLMMLILAPILFFIAFFTFFFGGVFLIPLSWIVGIVGFILLIVGIVAKSDLEQAALARPPVMQQPRQGYTTCPNCYGENYPGTKFCSWCGKPLSSGAGD